MTVNIGVFLCSEVKATAVCCCLALQLHHKQYVLQGDMNPAVPLRVTSRYALCIIIIMRHIIVVRRKFSIVVRILKEYLLTSIYNSSFHVFFPQRATLWCSLDVFQKTFSHLTTSTLSVQSRLLPLLSVVLTQNWLVNEL